MKRAFYKSVTTLAVVLSFVPGTASQDVQAYGQALKQFPAQTQSESVKQDAYPLKDAFAERGKRLP